MSFSHSPWVFQLSYMAFNICAYGFDGVVFIDQGRICVPSHDVHRPNSWGMILRHLYAAVGVGVAELMSVLKSIELTVPVGIGTDVALGLAVTVIHSMAVTL